MNNDFDEQFLYLTTIGRKTGLPREIEICFVELNNRLYVLAEHGYKAQWLQNVIATPSVTIRLAGRSWNATGRVLEPQTDELYLEVRDRARTKYGWGDGLPVEFRLVKALGKG
jgi:deazaflavin-dependent oxidoreductase (nitroreductase family)